MNHVLVSLCGYVGAGLILLGYFQVSRGAWHGKNAWFQLVNLVGSLLLVAYAIALSAYANVFLNGVWLVVAIAAASRIFLRRKS